MTKRTLYVLSIFLLLTLFLSSFASAYYSYDYYANQRTTENVRVESTKTTFTNTPFGTERHVITTTETIRKADRNPSYYDRNYISPNFYPYSRSYDYNNYPSYTRPSYYVYYDNNEHYSDPYYYQPYYNGYAGHYVWPN